MWLKAAFPSYGQGKENTALRNICSKYLAPEPQHGGGGLRRPRLSPCSLGEGEFAATSGQRAESDGFKIGRSTVMMIYGQLEPGYWDGADAGLKPFTQKDRPESCGKPVTSRACIFKKSLTKLLLSTHFGSGTVQGIEKSRITLGYKCGRKVEHAADTS